MVTLDFDNEFFIYLKKKYGQHLTIARENVYSENPHSIYNWSVAIVIIDNEWIINVLCGIKLSEFNRENVLNRSLNWKSQIVGDKTISKYVDELIEYIHHYRNEIIDKVLEN